ncbi:MAG: Wadjet anti-phage system protein JetD domain-containing protein, partial [bacterium]
DPRKRFTGELARLTDTEQTLYQALREDRLAPVLRLEQEQITQGWLLQALRSL